MSAKAIGDYLKTNFPGKKYMYITADYTWGWSTEESVRKFTGTEDTETHKGLLTPLGTKDFNKQLSFAKMVKPDVLVKGADYTVETVVGSDIVIANGGHVFLADLKAGFSTTRTIEKMGK